MDLEHGRGFVAVVEHGSIAAAADAIGVSRPTLSRHLTALEASLGVALLHRSTRSMRPTATGRQLYEALAPVLAEAAAVEARFAREGREVAGWLRVSVPPALAAEVSHVLASLQEAHPELAVQLLSSPDRVDLREGRIDVALRAGRLSDPDLVQRRIGGRAVRAWASPAYLAAKGVPTTVGELGQHRLLRSFAPDGSPRRYWPRHGATPLAVDGSFVSDDQAALRAMVAAGRGIALLDVRTAEGRPSLVPVLPDQVGMDLDVHAVMARRTLQPARVRAFVDAMVAAWAGGR